MTADDFTKITHDAPKNLISAKLQADLFRHIQKAAFLTQDNPKAQEELDKAYNLLWDAEEVKP
jgi:hypothetical protein